MFLNFCKSFATSSSVWNFKARKFTLLGAPYFFFALRNNIPSSFIKTCNGGISESAGFHIAIKFQTRLEKTALQRKITLKSFTVKVF